VAGDWTATTLDAVAEGTTYKRVKSTAINASGMIILDQCVVGTYGLVLAADITAGHVQLSACYGDLDDISNGGTYAKVLATDISAGHILLSETIKSGEWYDESGVEIDASHGINLYGTNNALTTRATKTGTIQCYVGSDGKLYAGAGAVILSSSGLAIEGQAASFLYSGAAKGYVYGSPGGMTVLAEGHLYLAASAGSFGYVQTDLVPTSDSYFYLGLGGAEWAMAFINQIGSASYKSTVYCNGLSACPLPTPLSALDTIRRIKAPVDMMGHFGRGRYFAVEDFPDEMKMDTFKIRETVETVEEKGKQVKRLKREKIATGKKDIEIIRTVGVLVQAVRELTAKVEALEAK
jgi:hypothetical protein